MTTLETRPLHPLLGVEIVGVDVTRVDAAGFQRIAAVFEEEHSVLLFQGQTLDDAAQIAFSRRFGPLETTIRTVVSHAKYRRGPRAHPGSARSRDGAGARLHPIAGVRAIW